MDAHYGPGSALGCTANSRPGSSEGGSFSSKGIFARTPFPGRQRTLVYDEVNGACVCLTGGFASATSY